MSDIGFVIVFDMGIAIFLGASYIVSTCSSLLFVVLLSSMAFA